MIFEEFLSKTIHENFDLLLTKFGFYYIVSEDESRNISFFYKKNGLLIRIKYNYPNQYLDFHLFKGADINNLIGADFISLPHILKDKNPEFQISKYNAIMPKVIPIERSLDILAKLVEEYATPYLEGKEWKSWRDIK